MPDPDPIPEGFTRNAEGLLVWQGGRYYREPGEAIATFSKGELRPGCGARVYQGYSYAPCGRPSKHDPDANGRPTRCGVHSKAAEQRRNDKREAADRAQRESYERAARVARAIKAIEPALRQIAAGHNDPRSLAAEVLAELDAARAAGSPADA